MSCNYLISMCISFQRLGKQYLNVVHSIPSKAKQINKKVKSYIYVKKLKYFYTYIEILLIFKVTWKQWCKDWNKLKYLRMFVNILFTKIPKIVFNH